VDDRDLLICGRDLEVIVLGGEEGVSQHLLVASPLDHALDSAEGSSELFLGDVEVHECSPEKSFFPLATLPMIRPMVERGLWKRVDSALRSLCREDPLISILSSHLRSGGKREKQHKVRTTAYYHLGNVGKTLV
jgi:hypothetical protein